MLVHTCVRLYTFVFNASNRASSSASALLVQELRAMCQWWCWWQCTWGRPPPPGAGWACAGGLGPKCYRHQRRQKLTWLFDRFGHVSSFQSQKEPLALRRPFCRKTLATYKHYKGQLGYPTTKRFPAGDFFLSCISFYSRSRARTFASAQNFLPFPFSIIF